MEHTEKFPLAPVIVDVAAPQAGDITEINAQQIGETSEYMGAGRVKKEDAIDHAVGIIVHHKVGDQVKQGDVLFTLHARDNQSMEHAKNRVLHSCVWSENACEPLPLFYEVIS